MYIDDKKLKEILEDFHQKIENKDESIKSSLDEAIINLSTKSIDLFGLDKSLYFIGNNMNGEDITQILNQTIETAGKAGGGTIYILSGEYKITDTIVIGYSNIHIIGQENAKLMYYGDGMEKNLFKVYGTWQKPIHHITIENLYIDGTHQNFKGGETKEDLGATSPNMLCRGMVGISLRYAYYVDIKHNTLNDIYGDGIGFQRCCYLTISNNLLFDCSASGMASLNKDYHGDGISGGMGFAILVENNYVINRRTFKIHTNYNSLNKDVYGLQCGRSGLEFEYSVNMDVQKNPERWCPFSAELQKNSTSSYHLIARGNYVYGYNKGFHLEYGVDALIDGNTFVHNNIGLIDATGGSTIIINNRFNSDGVGQSPQNGYSWYYAGIAITHFLGTNHDSNPKIINNHFRGDSYGIVLGRNKVTIENNDFRNTAEFIVTRLAVNKDIQIDGNRFYCAQESEKTVARFNVNLKYCKIINNSFISTKCGMTLNGCYNNCNISNNSFENTGIYCVYGNSNNIYNSNIFTNNIGNAKVSPIMQTPNSNSNITNNIFESTCGSIGLNTGTGTVFKDNIIKIKNVPSYYIIDAGSDSVISGNKITIDNIDTSTNKVLVRKFTASNTPNIDISNYLIIRDNVINGYSNKFYIMGRGDMKNVKNITIENNIPNRLPIKISTNRPMNGQYYNVGDKIEVGTSRPFTCISAGYYTDTEWTENLKVSNYKFVKNSAGNVYYLKTTNSKGTVPEPSGKKDIVIDDNSKWIYMGTVAKFEVPEE